MLLESYCHIQRDKNRLRIRVKDNSGRICYVYPGLRYSHSSILKAKEIVLLIDADVEAGVFDKNSPRYKFGQKAAKDNPHNLSIRIIADYWLKDRKNSVSKLTQQNNASMIRAFIASLKNKDTRFPTLTTKHIERFIRLEREKEVSLKVIYRKLKLLNKVFLWSKLRNYIAKDEINIFALFLEGNNKPKSDRSNKNKKGVLTLEETAKVISYINDDIPYQYLFYFKFKLLTGLRSGEALGLKWQDIEFDKRIIDINKQYHKGSIRDPKNNSFRKFIISEWLINGLKIVQKISKYKRPQSYVFANRDGKPFTFAKRKEYWETILSDLDIGYIVPYNTRHTYISNRITKKDNPSDIAKVTGHSIKTMLTFYAKYDAEEIAEA